MTKKYVTSSSTGETKEITEQEYRKQLKSRGLGDTIAKVTHRFGIKQCDACKKRQERLNKLFKYR